MLTDTHTSPSPRSLSILAIDDESEWLEMYNGALNFQGFHVSIADNRQDALELLKTMDFDLVITNLVLRARSSPAWLMECTLILDEVARQNKTAVIITAAVHEDLEAENALEDLQEQYAGIASVLRKRRLATFSLRSTVQKIFAKESKQFVEPVPPPEEPQLTSKQRSEMFLIAACVCEGLCEALKSALVLDEPLLKTAREIEQRIKQQIEQASDEAQQAWRDFQERPRENRGAFINVWLKSVSVSESMLYKCTCRFRNEVEHRKFVDFYTLLASNRFTHEQIKHICRQVDPELPGLGEGANQQDMAAWVYRYSNTNKVGRHLLICKVLETNPAAVLQLTYQS